MDVDAALFDDNDEDFGDVCLNVGIIGRPNVGKTEFIRAIVSDGTTATVPRQRPGTPYVYPTLPNVFFWELRNVENSANDCLKAIQEDKYDLFLILCDIEFGKTEFWLAEHFEKRNKDFFFVRTKMDKVIPDPSSTDEIPKTLFQEVSTKFAKYPTFAISNSRASGFDFPNLKKRFHCALISLKRFPTVGSGIESVKKYLESKLDEWKDAKIEVAIVGETGSGKSSLTNAIRNLKPSDPGAAKVGVTMEPIWFPHPDNGSIRLWDLPGVGSPNCSKEIYLEKVDVDIYDFFLIVSARRFTANDRWLVEELRKREKTYFFVRTKFDEAVEDEDNEEKIYHNRDIIIRDIKNNINLPDIRIYVLSSLYRDRYDFPQLLEDLICALPSVKQESLALTLTGYSKGIIEMKKKALKPKIWKAAIMSGGIGAVPVPGIDVAVDLVHETRFYRQTFGQNEALLHQLAEEFHIDTDRLKSAASKTGTMSLTKTGIKSVIFAGWIGLAFVTTTFVTSVLKVAVPVVGSVIGGGVSFAMTYGFLNKMLDNFASDAMAVYKLCADKMLADNTASTE